MTEVLSSTEVAAEPCNNFRLDTTSATFGVCKCGFPKSAHAAKKENKAEMMLTRLKNKNDERRHESSNDYDVSEPGDRACSKFRLDTTAAEFGMCKCGYKRADHEDAKENKAKKALERLKVSNADRMMDFMATDGPCANYRIDTSATEFGLCHCGYRKEDHVKKGENVAAQMLANLKRQNEKKNEMADLEAIGIKDDEDEEVTQLDKAEEKAEEPAPPQEEPTKKKKKKKCVVS